MPFATRSDKTNAWLIRVLAAVLFCAAGCESPPPEDEGGSEARYEVGRATPEGTGRYYLGREIAEVSGHAEWMERPERAPTELPGRIVKALELSPSDVAADIGAGTGYLTFLMSPEVPRGRVYAVDIQPEMLEIVRTRMQTEGVDNVVPVLGTEQDPRLPEEAVDVVLIVDSYHEFAYPAEMMENIREALRPGGRVVLVEYRGEDPTLDVASVHSMTEQQARTEMEAAGFVWRETRDILPQQHFMVFEKPLR